MAERILGCTGEISGDSNNDAEDAGRHGCGPICGLRGVICFKAMSPISRCGSPAKYLMFRCALDQGPTNLQCVFCLVNFASLRTPKLGDSYLVINLDTGTSCVKSLQGTYQT